MAVSFVVITLSRHSALVLSSGVVGGPFRWDLRAANVRTAFVVRRPRRDRSGDAGWTYPSSPVTVSSTCSGSILPPEVQIAPSAVQSVVAGSTTVTSPLPEGSTEISYFRFLPASSRRTLVTSPPATVNAWSLSVL